MCPTPSPSHNEKITHATVKTPCALTKPNKHIFLKKRKRTHQVKVEAETGDTSTAKEWQAIAGLHQKLRQTGKDSS